MKVVLPKQFHTDIIEGNEVYLYCKVMEESPAIPTPYLKYVDVFNETAEMILSPHWNNLNYGIELIFKTTPPFSLLYNLSKKELEILRDYIDKNLKSDYII